MVFKRYIKRGDKIYGPYIYHNKKINGKVVSTYLGKNLESENSSSTNLPKKGSVKEEKTKTSFPLKKLLIVGFVSLFLLFFFIFFTNFRITGQSILSIDNISSDGKILRGNLDFVLQQSEIIPAHTKVIINNDGIESVYILDDLINDSQIKGNYYIKDKELSGNGLGYGIAENKFPNVSFVLGIYTKSSSSKNPPVKYTLPVEPDNTQDNQTNTSQETSNNSVNLTGQRSITGNSILNYFIKIFRFLPKFIGHTSLQLEGEVTGNVSVNNPFIYNLSKGETAKILNSSEEVNLTIKNNQVILITNYLGDETKTFKIPIDKLNISSGNNLNVSFVFNGTELMSASKTISNSSREYNLPELNFSNQTSNESINQASNNTNLNITTVQSQAIVGKPVKWTKLINLNNTKNLLIEIPRSAENISIETDKEPEEVLRQIQEEKSLNNLSIGKITGLNIRKNKGLFSKIKEWFRRKTGKVILESEIENYISETQKSKLIELNKIINLSKEKKIIVQYYTPAPMIYETNLSEKKKRITITGPDELEYKNILAYAKIPLKIFVSKKDKIKIYWVKSHESLPNSYSINDNSSNVTNEIKNLQTKELIDFTTIDENDDSIIDYIEWNVPHLSNQTYEIVIEITKAEHLDENKVFISDIYDNVKELDNNWSEIINKKEYVRVSFEKSLNNKNDITIYARSVNYSLNNKTAKIKVYSKNENKTIAEFSNITNENWYKVYLTNLSENENYSVFDLNILDNPVEFDYIVDPVTAYGNASYTIKNSSDDEIAVFYDSGTLTIAGTCTSGGSCDSPPANSFIIQNSSGDNNSYIDSNGNLCIETGDCSDESVSCSNPPDGSFVIQDNSGNNVSYISPDGDLCLTGKLVEGYSSGLYIENVAPANTSTENTNQINFTYTVVTDNNSEIKNCSLYLYKSGVWELNASNSTPITQNVNQYINISLEDGSFLWKINCYDTNGQKNSSAYNLTISTGGCDYYLDSCKTSGWQAGKTYCLNQSISATVTCMQIDNDDIT
ncbi:hypothetical protein DRN73_03755, partial [Candidatus Pacearchaeota archaeon]